MENSDFDHVSSYKPLFLIGGIMALLASILFRRNLAVEIGLFSNINPISIEDYFNLLQTNRFLGLTYLHFFDVINYILLIPLFLSLYIILKKNHQSILVLALVLFLIGITTYFSSNIAFSIVSLSEQYAQTTDVNLQKELISAGYALFAHGRFSSGAFTSMPGFISLLFVAIATLIMSLTMLQSLIFSKFTSWIGIIAGGLDIIYCFAYVFFPLSSSAKVSVICLPIGGLLLLIWHLLLGIKLIKIYKMR